MVDCLINRKSDRLLKEQFYKPFAFSLSLFAVVEEKSRIFSALSLSFMDTMQSNYIKLFRKLHQIVFAESC